MPGIIDSHVHFITIEMADQIKERMTNLYPYFKERIKENSKQLMNENFIDYLSKKTIKGLADDWIAEMDKNGIDHALFFPISETLEQVRDFVNIAPDRFSGYIFLNNLTEKEAPEKIRKFVKEYNLKGLKIYPSVHMVHSYDKSIFPIYEEAQSLNIPIMFHFGITHAPVCDYGYTNPIDLQLPLKLFPRLNFIIAHFGAGYFREVCLLAFHNNNLYLDTSGTNNWRFYTPENMPLKEVFKRAIEIYSPDRIIFGTDTVLGRETGYRAKIKEEQVEIIGSLNLTTDEQQKILSENAKALYGITL